MAEDYAEYVVSEVSGESSSHGNPDRIANMILDRWGLIPKGENPAERLFLAAVPASKFVGSYRLKVLQQGTRLQAWLYGHEEGDGGGKLDFGPVIEDESELTNGHKKFVIEGNFLSKITVLCHPVLQEEVHDENLQEAAPAPEVPQSIVVENHALPLVAGASSVAELMDIPVNRIRRNKEQPRKKFNAGDLLILGMSMKDSGQTDRIEVIRVEGDPDADFELVKGERRWRAAQLVGISVLHAIVLTHDQIPDKNIQHRVCLISDLHHSHYNDVEIAFALARQKLAGNNTLQQLATMCKKKSIAWVSQHLAITSLDPQLLKLLNPDLPKSQRMSFAIAWRIARLTPVDQVKVYAQVSKIKGAKLQLIETEKLVARVRPSDGRRTTSADLYKNLSVMVPRMLADASIAEGYPGEVFLSFIQHRPADEVALVLEHIQKTITHLGAIQSRILAAKQKWAECEKI